jgi:hypothetical protein
MAKFTRKRAPAKLGTLIDKLFEARERRLAETRRLDALKKIEDAAEQRVLAALQQLNLQKAAGARATVSITVKTVGQVEPERWADVQKYIVEKNAFDLLQRRLNNAAVRERVEAGEEIPGLKTVQILDLSVRSL